MNKIVKSPITPTNYVKLQLCQNRFNYMSWLTILPNINPFCHTVSEQLCSEGVMNRYRPSLCLSVAECRETKTYHNSLNNAVIDVVTEDLFLIFNSSYTSYYVYFILVCANETFQKGSCFSLLYAQIYLWLLTLVLWRHTVN
jgi:hypothetical protein